ncbi:ATP-binding protein [Brevibacterium limosum]|uniref:ATP-binding protein n=1 Tax=Brevibacterium limosum TaxID=2697565 RepID=UPI00142400C5|nr:ATP-binding protein [Brevibacterium limosum]
MSNHLTTDDMATFTQLRMTAFGQAVVDIANDSDYDDWTFSAKIHHALDIELAARAERRVHKLLKASHTPNPAACVEDLPDRTLTRDVVDRLASCAWIENATNVIILGKTSVGKSYLAQALVNAACRKDYTVAYWRLDDLGNRLAVYQPSDPGGLRFLDSLRNCDVLVLDDFLTTPISMDTTAKILNILASREGRGATIVTSQFDPEDWYKSLHDAVIAESILSRLVSVSEIVQLDGPNMRKKTRQQPEVDSPA